MAYLHPNLGSLLSVQVIMGWDLTLLLGTGDLRALSLGVISFQRETLMVEVMQQFV